MTIRTRIADWISGGALTRAREHAAAREMDARLWMAQSMEQSGREIQKGFKIGDLERRLNAIAAQEKPTSNATVRRMARIARGEE